MKWSDEYWPLLVKIYKKKPEGVKPVYSQPIVELALELHITPQELHRKMLEVRNSSTPFVKKLTEDYSSPSRLNKAVKIIRQNQGLGNAGQFFEGVETIESWEKDFRPLEEDKRLKPVHLILILDLYFQLTPTTMVSDTEEIQDLARMMKLPVSLIIEIMDIFQFLDPYLNTNDFMIHPLIDDCSDIWKRYGNDDIDRLNGLAAQLKEYFHK